MKRGSAILLVSWAACLPAAAYEYPTKPVKLVVGTPAGDTVDLLARLMAPSLGKFFKQPFIVDNHAGAMGNLAAARVAKASPDGHTLLVVSSSFATNISVYPHLSYHPERDFTPVARLVNFPQVLVVNSGLDASTLAEFISLVRASPGRITIASDGTGTTSHLAAELLKVRAGWLNALHVPYKGTAQALAHLMGNHVHALIATVASAYPHVRTGRLRALAVASTKRVGALADVPTFGESGFPGFEAAAWGAVVAPTGTAYDTVVRLNLAIGETMSSPLVRARYAVQGAEPVHEPPEQFRDYLHGEVEKWAKVAKTSGIGVE
jgi:tripartite-type tricarboxylate transporter receptor subunit TctC